MKKLQSKKTIIGALALVLILLVSLAVELFLFNGAVWKLPEAERTTVRVKTSDLLLTDMVMDENGILQITGDSPSFALPGEGYVQRLELETDREAEPMHVQASNSEKSYDVKFAFKPVTVLNVGAAADEVHFSLTMDGEEATEVMLASVVVDNTLQVNLLRVLFLVSVGLLVWYFLLFGETAREKLHITLLVLAVTVGVNMALTLPVWYGYDEHAHFVRAYQFANGNLGFDHEAELNWVEDIEEFFVVGGSANAAHSSYSEREAFVQKFSDTQYPISKYFLTTASTYPFVPYFFAGLGILLAKLLGMPFIYTFYAGRIFNVLGYALVCALAVKHAKIGKRLLFLLALVPYALFSSAVYTADTMTIAFSLLAISLFGNMLAAEDGSLDWKQPAAFGVSVGLMALCKLPYAAFCALILAVPFKKYRSNKAAWLNMLLVVGLVGFISVATLLFGADKGIIQWYQPGMSLVGQVKYILTHPFTYVALMLEHVVKNWDMYLADSITNMGYCPSLSGLWVAVVIAAGAALSLLDREEQPVQFGWPAKLMCVLSAGAAWVLTLTALYLSFNVVGADHIRGVQGRYFFPLLILLFLLLKNRRLNLPVKKQSLNVLCGLLTAVMGVAAMWNVLSGYCM